MTTDIVTSIRVLAEEWILRHGTTPATLILGDAEHDAMEAWVDENLRLVQDPTLVGTGVEFMGMRVVRSGRARGIGFEGEK